MNISRLTLFSLALIAGLAPAASAAIRYVDDTAPPGGNGTSWALAYRDLQLALAAAAPTDEVRIAQGTYRPASPGGSRSLSFVLKPSVTIKGGYAGFGAPMPDARDPALYLTTLTGDLNSNDPAEPPGGVVPPTAADNSYHLVRVNLGTTGAVLDGVTIRAGNADAPSFPDNCGGGILVNGTHDPCFLTCRIIANRADHRGGGAFIDEDADADFTSCSFLANEAWDTAPTPTGEGGGLYNAGVGLIFNCVFSGNRALLTGGGAYSIASTINPCFANCTFVANYARLRAGGLALDALAPSDAVDIANCILWGNTTGTGLSPQMHNVLGTHTVRYSNIQGGWPGVSNVDMQPRLTDVPPILRRPLASGDFRLLPTSPMIDRGDSLAVSGNNDTGTVAPGPSGGPRFRDDPNSPNLGVPASDPFFPGLVVDIGAEEIAENYTRWLNPAGGLWSSPANWMVIPPISVLTAAFDTPGTFTVTLTADADAQRLLILDGFVTIDMGGFDLIAQSPMWPSRNGIAGAHDPCFLPTNGKLVVDRFLIQPERELAGGNASGSKIIEGTVVNTGHLNPGEAAGMPYADYAIQGTFFNRSTGTGPRSGQVNLDLAGPTPGSQRDHLFVGGEADLGGGLRVQLRSGYLPGLGVSLDLVEASGGVTSPFDSVLLPSVGTGRVLTYSDPESAAPITITVTTRATDVDAGQASIVGIPGVATAAAPGDLNADGLPDLAVTYLLAGGAGRVRIYRNAGADANGWLGFPTSQIFSVGLNPSDVAIGDIDDNGQPDVIVANQGSDTLTIFEATGGGTFTGSTISTLPVVAPATLSVGDFNGDGKSDIAVGGVSEPGFEGLGDPGGAGLVSILLSTSTLARGEDRAATFVNGGVIRTLKPVVTSASSDIDNDKWDDIVIPDDDDAMIEIDSTSAYRSDGDAEPFDDPPLESLGGAGDSIVVIDLNNDGFADIATADSARGVVSIARGFTGAVAYDVGTNPTSLISGDFAGDDGAPDLALLIDGASPGTRAIQVLRNDTPPATNEIVLTLMPLIPTTAGDEYVLAALDLDGDGADDPVAISGEAPALARADAQRGTPVPKVYLFTRDRCPGDANHDGAVNFADITAVLASFASSGFRFMPGDADGDGDVDFADITNVLANFALPCL